MLTLPRFSTHCFFNNTPVSTPWQKAKLWRQTDQSGREIAKQRLQMVKFVALFHDLPLADPRRMCWIQQGLRREFLFMGFLTPAAGITPISHDSITCYAQFAVFGIPAHFHQRWGWKLGVRCQVSGVRCQKAGSGRCKHQANQSTREPLADLRRLKSSGAYRWREISSSQLGNHGRAIEMGGIGLSFFSGTEESSVAMNLIPAFGAFDSGPAKIYAVRL